MRSTPENGTSCKGRLSDSKEEEEKPKQEAGVYEGLEQILSRGYLQGFNKPEYLYVENV